MFLHMGYHCRFALEFFSTEAAELLSLPIVHLFVQLELLCLIKLGTTGIAGYRDVDRMDCF